MLPNMKPGRRCIARAKSTSLQCKNPAKGDGKVCRLHGWVDPKRRARNEKHGRYVHGNFTQSRIERRKAKNQEMYDLMEIAVSVGMVPKNPMRKPHKKKEEPR